jgi:CBS domain-containing protein
MKVSEIMTRAPATVEPLDSLAHAAQLMRDGDIGMVPVVENERTMRLLGVLTDRDIAIRCVADGHDPKCLVQDHMTSGALDTVRPDDDVREVISRMERDQIRRVPVVEDGDRLAGIVSQADLVIRLGPKDPRVVEEVIERISRPSATA